LPFPKSKSPSDAITSSFSFIRVSSISIMDILYMLIKFQDCPFLITTNILDMWKYLQCWKRFFTSIWECWSRAFHDANGSRHYSLMTFHIQKWINWFFITDKVMFTLVSMRSYKLVNSIVWDVGTFSFTLIEFKTFMHRQGGGTTFVSCIHFQFEKPSPCQHIEWPTTNLFKWHLTSLSTYYEFCMFKKKL
jgi:hypothetical protein